MKCVGLVLIALALPVAAAAQDKAASFPGALDRIVVGPVMPGESFTVEMWVDLALTDNETLVCAADPAYLNAFCLQYRGPHWVLEINDADEFEANSCDQPHPHICYDDDRASSPGPLHVAAVVTPTEMSLWLDGVRVATAPTGEVVDWTDAEWALGIDAEPEISPEEPAGWNNDSLDGVLDEVRVWDHARSADEMACLRDWTLTGEEEGLVALWSLDTETGGVTPDSTGNGYDGTMYGTTALVASEFGLTASEGGDIGCFDFDDDGWTPDGGDCDDRDPGRAPDVEEIPNDGIDQDCDGSDLTDIDDTGTDDTGTDDTGTDDTGTVRTRLRGGLAACGCAATPPAASRWGWAVALLALARRRRRR